MVLQLLIDMFNLEKNKGKNNKLLNLVANEFGRGSYKLWKNKEFEDLSFAIHRRTKVLISPATLKRIFGKVSTKESYTPQSNTLEALQDFVADTVSEDNKKDHVRLKWILFAIIPLLLVVLWFLVPFNNSTNTIKNGQLSLMKIEGEGPTTAYFNFTVPEYKDTVFLDFGDGSEWFPILKSDQSRSHFYHYPGYFSASLRTRHHVVSDTLKIFVPTKGWQSLTHYFDIDKIERYFPVPLISNTRQGVFHASRRNLSSLGIDSTEIVVVRLDNFKQTNVSGDSFDFKVRFKNGSFWPGVRCFSVHLSIIGTKGKIEHKFSGEGCSHYSYYTLGEKTISGTMDDLSMLSVDLHQWSDISILNDQKCVSVMKGDSLLYTDSYEQSIGNILGCTVLFHGSGSVDYIRLIDKNGNAWFNEEFNEE